MNIFLDSMLLSLLVVGTASREYIPKHKRLRNFTISDFELLLDNISRASSIVVTPNTLTETSNWVKMIAEPARSHVGTTFRYMIETLDERYIRARQQRKALSFRDFG